LRWFQQNGSAADTGAIFLAVSYEYNATLQHNIQINGYDVGRDLFVGNATNASTTSPGGFVYTATNYSVPLLSGVDASQLNHGIGVDGNVAVLTVKVTKTGAVGANRTNAGTSGGSESGALALHLGRVAISTAVVLGGISLGIAMTL
jgi:hypothetical protein